MIKNLKRYDAHNNEFASLDFHTIILFEDIEDDSGNILTKGSQFQARVSSFDKCVEITIHGEKRVIVVDMQKVEIQL